MRTILAVVPGIKVTGMAVYGESPTVILTQDRAEMEWLRRMTLTSRRPPKISAKRAIEGHVGKLARALSVTHPGVSELWIEGHLDESVKGRPALSKSGRHRVELVEAFLGIPSALTMRPQGLTTVLVEPGEWRGWANEKGQGDTLRESVERLVDPTEGLHDNILYAMALGMYAGEFSRSTSTQPKSAELPEKE